MLLIKNKQIYGNFSNSSSRINYSSSIKLIKTIIMKKTENSPVSKFRYLLNGSAMAKNLSFLYVITSLMLAYKMRDHLEYFIPLIIGALLILWYTLTYLTLKGFNPKGIDLQNQLKLYRRHIVKREKYESSVFFIWILTIVPGFLFGKEISIFTVIIFMIAIYLMIVLGGYLFKRAKNQLHELELQIIKID